MSLSGCYHSINSAFSVIQTFSDENYKKTPESRWSVVMKQYITNVIKQ